MFEIDGVRWWLADGVDPARTRDCITRALANLGAGAIDHKAGRRKQLFALALEGKDTDHLLKVNRYDRGASPLRRLRRSKARHELEVATALAGAGVATPVPLAAGEKRRGRLLHDCYLLLPVVPNAVELGAHWRRARTPPEERRALARSLGSFLFAYFGVRLISRSPMVHVDGPRSVRAAFAIDEIASSAEAAGLRGATVASHWPFRLLLRWERQSP